MINENCLEMAMFAASENYSMASYELGDCMEYTENFRIAKDVPIESAQPDYSDRAATL